MKAVSRSSKFPIFIYHGLGRQFCNNQLKTACHQSQTTALHTHFPMVPIPHYTLQWVLIQRRAYPIGTIIGSLIQALALSIFIYIYHNKILLFIYVALSFLFFVFLSTLINVRRTLRDVYSLHYIHTFPLHTHHLHRQ